MLPISLVSEPATSCLIREKDKNFIAKLKKEMLENPVNDVQPIICIVNLPEKAVFQSALKETYTYSSVVIFFHGVPHFFQLYIYKRKSKCL